MWICSKYLFYCVAHCSDHYLSIFNTQFRSKMFYCRSMCVCTCMYVWTYNFIALHFLHFHASVNIYLHLFFPDLIPLVSPIICQTQIIRPFMQRQHFHLPAQMEFYLFSFGIFICISSVCFWPHRFVVHFSLLIQFMCRSM